MPGYNIGRAYGLYRVETDGRVLTITIPQIPDLNIDYLIFALILPPLRRSRFAPNRRASFTFSQ